MTNKEYLEFMYNEDNKYNCAECPENGGYSNHQNILPCGQQNCWVECHCQAGNAPANCLYI